MCCMQTETRTNTNLKLKSCCTENSGLNIFVNLPCFMTLINSNLKKQVIRLRINYVPLKMIVILKIFFIYYP